MSSISKWIGFAGLSAGLLLATARVFAQSAGPDLPPNITASVISGNALANMHGRAAVNVVAGDSNVQANAAALAIGLGESPAHALSGIRQTVDPAGATAAGAALAVIGERAFANASGMVSINQTSGAANAQANAAALSLGVGAEAVADSRLAATASGRAPAATGTDPALFRGVSIADTAFEGAHGLVQVNQSAGSGNRTANHFALKAQLGANP